MPTGDFLAQHGLIDHGDRPPLPPPTPTVVGHVLDRFARSTPEAEALAGRWTRYTYAELDRAVDAAADLLAGMGVAARGRVGGCMGNHPDLVVAFLAAMRLGAIWVGVNRALAPVEKLYLARDSGLTVLLADPETVSSLGGHRSEVPELAHLFEVDASSPTGEWRDALRAGVRRPTAIAAIASDAPAAIAYTSGTTGRPKGVVHSHRNLLLPGAWRATTPRPGDSRAGVCLPLTILNLMILGPLSAFQVGCASVAMDRIDARGVAEWVRDEQLTSVTVPPTILHDLLTSPDITDADLATLRYPGSGGTAVPEDLRQRFLERFGTPVTASYGLTEAPTAVTLSVPSAVPEPGGSGRAMPYVEIRITGSPIDDGSAGAVVAVGEEGEICVAPARSGPWADVYTPMLGYWDRPDATATALAGGVLHTGDIGYLSAGGELHVTARKSELIIRGGANVYPAEVERVLDAHPAVSASAVIGIPDERLGERVVAVVATTQPGTHGAHGAHLAHLASELRAHCQQYLARYKVPDEVLVVDGLPRNAMGKVARAELQALFASGPADPEQHAPPPAG